MLVLRRKLHLQKDDPARIVEHVELEEAAVVPKAVAGLADRPPLGISAPPQLLVLGSVDLALRLLARQVRDPPLHGVVVALRPVVVPREPDTLGRVVDPRQVGLLDRDATRPRKRRVFEVRPLGENELALDFVLRHPHHSYRRRGRHAGEVGTSMSARARLQLVVARPPDLGPISPELALVSPELAAAAREQLPDPPWMRPDRAAGGPTREPLRPVLMRTLFASTAIPPKPAPADPPAGVYDTADRDLNRHDLTLERHVSEGVVRWRLVLARGEVVEDDEEQDGEPPASIAALVHAVVGGESLVPVPWHADDPDVQRFQEQIWEQRRALLRHDPGTRLAVDAENLHQFRVAGRRLRAFLRVGRSLVDEEWSAAVRAGLSELGRAGGPVRDLDVLLERLEEEVAGLDPDQLPAAMSLLGALAFERDHLRETLRETLDLPVYAQLLDRLAAPVPVVPVPGRFSLRKLARRELKRLVRDVRRLGDAPSDTDLHALRIRVKRARYAVELAGDSTPEAEPLIASAKAVQDILGEHQDTVVAERLLFEQATEMRDAAVAFVAGRLAERETVRREQLRERLPTAWKQLRRAARRF